VADTVVGTEPTKSRSRVAAVIRMVAVRPLLLQVVAAEKAKARVRVTANAQRAKG
jgi:hypothetical protein